MSHNIRRALSRHTFIDAVILALAERTKYVPGSLNQMWLRLIYWGGGSNTVIDLFFHDHIVSHVFYFEEVEFEKV